MRALVVSGPGRMGVEQRPSPEVPDGSIAVRPTVVGICGTDIDIIEGTIDPFYVRYPIVLGHEWSGVVIDSGTDPTAPPNGSRVVVEGVIPCRHCAECTAGHTNLCLHYDEFGFVRDGAAADILVAPARLAHRLDPRVSAESGALVEPAAVVMRALLRVNPQPGSRVLVVGDGTVGLLAATLARIWSPASVTMLGARPDQGPLAASARVDHFHTDPTRVEGDFDLVVEAAGAPAAVALAIKSPRRGGSVVILGLSGHGVTVPIAIDDLVNNDITIAGSFSYTTTAWAKVVALLNAGQLDLGFLVTHRYPIDQWEQAISLLRSSRGARGKVLLDITPADLA